jgi:urease accessory protein
VVGGDELRVRVEAGQGTHALVTTPAAAKLYRSLGKVARCHSTLHVREQAIVEWLPGETLAFDGARVDLRTKVQLAPGGVFVGWEIVGLGRPACNERFAAGKLAQRFEIWRGEEPLWIERGRYAGDAAVLREPWGLGAAPVSGVLAAVPADANILEAARSAVVAGKDWTFSATLLEQTLVARVLSKSAAQARTCLEAVWRALRPAVVGRPACAPRIWKT